MVFYLAIVAPLAGAWIEIFSVLCSRGIRASLPSRERGLKSYELVRLLTQNRVAPLAGAWIEICLEFDLEKQYKVAPLAGAWIEILIVQDAE